MLALLFRKAEGGFALRTLSVHVVFVGQTLLENAEAVFYLVLYRKILCVFLLTRGNVFGEKPEKYNYNAQ